MKPPPTAQHNIILSLTDCLDHLVEYRHINHLLDERLTGENRSKRGKDGKQDKWEKWEKWTISQHPIDIPFTCSVCLTSNVVYKLLSSKAYNLHLGTVLLGVWLDKPRTYNKIRPYLHMFSDREIDSAIRYAVRLGIRKILRSKPSIGYAYKRKANQRVV